MNLLSLYVKFRVNVMTLKLRWHPYCQFSTDSPSVTNVSLPKNVYRAHLQTTLNYRNTETHPIDNCHSKF